ncbi:TetR/AcrR family transcriptional regulator [Myxococcus sp. RHSTA-1-4]|uniref:TetR/AcrR family transcriptional regulator n=1 Tax=Myxococcus sp. RHSTA-1-4 TaxID=2874601 RepID=UPI001CBDA81B|nr:TetR/AcrR family transcriptional regulator [Myxococcus sp. RHSTA-1-4]MBZ4416305.1 TetR family transcriptional regulator [Myxococcus sp. RHSTA-1-4]
MWTAEQLYLMSMRDSAAVMARRGYGNVRAEEMARAANLSVGSFYRRYGSKGAFAHRVRQWAESELCRIARIVFEVEPSSREDRNFRHTFEDFWQQLAWFATRRPECFHFAFMHWHEDSLEPQSFGDEARALVREVLALGEREGALAPGSVRVGEGLIWGALAELVRALARGEEASLVEEDVNAAGRALWKALAAEEDSPSRGTGIPPPGTAVTGDSEPGNASTSAPAAAHVESERTGGPALVTGAASPETLVSDGMVPGHAPRERGALSTRVAPPCASRQRERLAVSPDSRVVWPQRGRCPGPRWRNARGERPGSRAAVNAAGHPSGYVQRAGLHRGPPRPRLLRCTAMAQAPPGGALPRANPYRATNQSPAAGERSAPRSHAPSTGRARWARSRVTAP